MIIFKSYYLPLYSISFVFNLFSVLAYDSTLILEQPAIEIIRTVFFKGFHRILQYNITIPNFSKEKQLIIVDSLPKDIYVDPYQISEAKGRTVFKILGSEPVDTEAPAYKAKPFQISMCLVSEDNEHTIDLPIHFRYQAPHQCSLLGNKVVISMKSPSVYSLSNYKDRENICERGTSVFLPNQDFPWRKLETVSSNTHFEIPTGCLEHMFLVTVSTACIISGSTIFLCYVMMTLKIDKR